MDALPRRPQLASAGVVAHHAVAELVQKASAKAGKGHIPVFVLQVIPPVQNKLYQYPQPGDHRRLHDLAAGRIPEPLQSLRPVCFRFFRSGLALRQPGRVVFCLCFLQCRLCLVVPLPLGRQILHGAYHDLGVLLALGAEHAQGLQHLVLRALHSCPLHHGIVGLCPLHHPPELTHHGFLVSLAAVLHRLGGQVSFRQVIFGQVLLYIVLSPVEQAGHRHLVHPANASARKVCQSVHGSGAVPQHHVLAVPGPVVGGAEHALFFRRVAQFPPAAAPQAGGQQGISKAVGTLNDAVQLAGLQVHHKLHGRCTGSAPAQLCRCRGQACCLQQGHVQVSRQHGGSGIAPQHAAQVVKHLAVSLAPAQIGHGLLHVLASGPSPAPFNGSVLCLAALHTVQHLLGVPQRDRHTCKLGGIFYALAGLLHQAHQSQGLGAVLSGLHVALAAHAHVPAHALVLLHKGVSVHVHVDVVFHPGTLYAVQGHAGLVDVPLCQLAQLPEIADPQVIVSRQVLFDLTKDAGAQRVLPLADLVGIQLAAVLVGGHQFAQRHSLGVLLSQPGKALGGKAHVRNGGPAVQKVVHALPVLQLYPQLGHHVMGHQPGLAVPGL